MGYIKDYEGGTIMQVRLIEDEKMALDDICIVLFIVHNGPQG